MNNFIRNNYSNSLMQYCLYSTLESMKKYKNVSKDTYKYNYEIKKALTADTNVENKEVDNKYNIFIVISLSSLFLYLYTKNK